MKKGLLMAVLTLSLTAYPQHETYTYSQTKEGKLRYEFQVHKCRKHLVDEFFKLFSPSRSVWILKDDQCIALARRTRKGFEVIGDGKAQEFQCPAANLCIDLWLEFAHVNG